MKRQRKTEKRRTHLTIYYPRRNRFIVVKTAKKLTDICVQEFYNTITHRIPEISIEEYQIL